MLEVRLLGQFELRRDGAVVLLPSRPAQSLLAYLALSAGTTHRREKLAGLLWPDADDDNARKSLRHALWRIRKSVEPDQAAAPYLLTDELTVSFNAGAEYWLDTAVLSRDGDALQEQLVAVEAYRGELLPGFYDEWVALERERLEALFQIKMQRLLDRLIEERRWAAVVDWGERWVALGNAPEPGYRALMLAHAELGDRARVAQVFRRCREALFNELGVQPSAPTRRLYARLCQDEAQLAFGAGAPPAAAAARDEAPTPGEPPYQGLHYFDEADADRFFGRERLTARLIERLQTEPFVAVIGASGSGKSSVVRAGLVPALRQSRLDEADAKRSMVDGRARAVRVLTPTRQPLEALATRLLPEEADAAARTAMLDELARDPQGLRRYLTRAAQARQPLVVVIDQFEELFTLCHDPFEREAFVENVLVAAEGDGPVRLVVALRADFYAHCAEYTCLREAVAAHQEYVGPMTASELQRAVEGPARRGGWELEPGLVEVLLRDIGEEPGALPLLSHALLETWRQRKGRQLTLAGYTAAGGVRGAIAQTGDTVFATGLSGTQRRVARRIFLQLTELGEGGPDTRRRASIGELVGRPEDESAVREVLQVLADARLVTLDACTAEVAHEALIREWPTLREWLEQDRERLRLQRQLHSAAHEWQRSGRDASLLHRGLRLSQMAQLARERAGELSPLDQEFLAASERNVELELAEREAQRGREEEAARITRSREVAATAINNLDVDPERSILLALEAIRVHDPATSEAEAALHQAVQASRTQLTLRGHTGGVLAAAFSPDGRRVVTGGLDGTARVWDARTGVEVLMLVGHTAEVDAASFSPDGARIASASRDCTATVWDAETGAHLFTLAGHTGGVRGIAFSPDGLRLAAASTDGTACVWDVTTGQEFMRLGGGNTAPLLAIAYSPGGRCLVTGGQDATATVWDATTGAHLRSLIGHTGAVEAVACSPDGRFIATSGGADFTFRLWDAANGRELQTLSAEGCSAQTVAFSPDSTRLAAATSCGRAWVLDARTGRELFALRGHARAVLQIAFSPDGKRVLTASEDGSARLWDAGPGGNELLTLVGHTAIVFHVRFSPDGGRIATGSWDGTARVWDAATGTELLTLRGHSDEVYAVAFSPDGRALATASADNTARVWNLMTGRERLRLIGHGPAMVGEQRTVARTFTGPIELTYSPDGSRLATAGADGTARLWDASSGQELLVLRGHQAPVNSVAFDADGARLATAGDDGTFRVWDAATGQQLQMMSCQTERAFRVAFSADGTHLATSGVYGTTSVWDLARGRERFSLAGHTGAVRVTYSADGTRLATASAGGTTKVWDAVTGRELLSLRLPGGGAADAAFSPDGLRLAVASSDALVRVYLLRLEDLVTLARARLTRSLTLDECRRFLHLERCPEQPEEEVLSPLQVSVGARDVVD